MNEHLSELLSTDFKLELAIQSLLMATACDFDLYSPVKYLTDIQTALLMGAEIADD